LESDAAKTSVVKGKRQKANVKSASKKLKVDLFFIFDLYFLFLIFNF